MHPRVEAPLLDYKRLLWLLSIEFYNREFTTAEASRRLVERFDLLGFLGMNLGSRRLRPKLVSTALWRLKCGGLAEARRVPRLVTIKSGKRANRGFMNVWRLTPKASIVLRTAKANPLNPKGLFKALLRERHRFSLREDPHYVYESVLTLNLEINSLLYSSHPLTQQERERLDKRAKEFQKLMVEMRAVKPDKHITEAALRAIDDAQRLNGRYGLA